MNSLPKTYFYINNKSVVYTVKHIFKNKFFGDFGKQMRNWTSKCLFIILFDLIFSKFQIQPIYLKYNSGKKTILNGGNDFRKKTHLQ